MRHRVDGRAEEPAREERDGVKPAVQDHVQRRRAGMAVEGGGRGEAEGRVEEL